MAVGDGRPLIKRIGPTFTRILMYCIMSTNFNFFSRNFYGLLVKFYECFFLCAHARPNVDIK